MSNLRRLWATAVGLLISSWLSAVDDVHGQPLSHGGGAPVGVRVTGPLVPGGTQIPPAPGAPGRLPSGVWSGVPSAAAPQALGPLPTASPPATLSPFAAALAGHQQPAPAPPPPVPAPASLTPPIGTTDALVGELSALRTRLEKLEADAAKPAGEKPPGDKPSGDKDKSDKDKAEKKDGWQDLSAEKWTVKLGGHVQTDYIVWPNKDPAITDPLAKNYFEFRRLRLVADGTGYGVYDFRLQMTLEPETVGETPGVTSPDVKDAYFSINETPWFGRIRIGNFFVPSSLEQVTNDTNNVFLERSIPTQGVFSVDREVGLASYNHSADMNFTWTYGIFIDSISESLKERIDNNQGYRLVGRVTWLPYYDEPSNGRYLIHTGLSVLYTDDQDGLTRVRARPQIHEGPRLIDTGIIPASDYTTGGMELAAVMGRFTVQSESFVSGVNRTTAANATYYGCYVHGSYFLTGENRIYERFGQHGAQFARNVPFSNVFWTKGARGLGAWELKARWSYLDLTDVSRGIYNDFTFGFNWYWSDRVRAMFDWIHPITSSETLFGSTNSDILAMRFDWNW